MLNEDRTWCVYLLIDPRTEKPRYVGQTMRFNQRMKDHMMTCDRGTTHKDRWLTQLKNLDLKPTVKILEDNLTKDEWADAEIKWINRYRKMGCDLTNRSDGGEGSAGVVHTQETKEKMSVSRQNSAWSRYSKGLPVSQEELLIVLKAREKLKLSKIEYWDTKRQAGDMSIGPNKKKKVLSPEHCELMRQRMVGTKQSAERTALAVNARKANGYRHTPETIAKITAANRKYREMKSGVMDVLELDFDE